MFRTRGARQICWLAIVAIFFAAIAFAALHYGTLPATIPTHFDLAGEPNGYGPRGDIFAVSLLLGTVDITFYLAGMLPVRRLRPDLTITPENEARIRGAILDLLASLAFGIAAIDLALTIMLVGSAENRIAVSNFAIPAIVGMFVIVPLGVYAYRTRSA